MKLSTTETVVARSNQELVRVTYEELESWTRVSRAIHDGFKTCTSCTERRELDTSITRHRRGAHEGLASEVRGGRARGAREEFHECVDRFYTLVKLLPSNGESSRVTTSSQE